ncbi:hypothetical protein L5515_007818 [Caenorhabditis briggsae]|nr:hypothetical protein L3Y34_007969 [Caenorhabditis briggsae]UMM34997.1 hypothetical protein L5515_007818 [Caenorhabditis briggsae]
MEFVPIGKDTSAAIVPVNNKPIESTVVSHKVFKEDGIKYTEIVRRTPSGGIQTSHIKGTVNPSILPVPVPNLSGLMSRIQTRIASRMEVSSPPRKEYYPPDMDPLGRADGPIYHRTTGFEPLPRHPYPPPPYPPMMMYPPSPDSLMGRVGSMTGNILDNVMEFVMGRRR